VLNSGGWRPLCHVRLRVPYVIVGAGVHGLSTAWHLARELRARGLGGGEDILVLDKRGPGAGASGIACGTVRNNYFQYFQPANRELMAHSVSVRESDPAAFSYHPVGFLQIAPEAMTQDVAGVRVTGFGLAGGGDRGRNRPGHRGVRPPKPHPPRIPGTFVIDDVIADIIPHFPRI
jgi:glycine/D-amino acid oxidase-like deaminating enzyme